jgi:hypothetical protein
MPARLSKPALLHIDGRHAPRGLNRAALVLHLKNNNDTENVPFDTGNAPEEI